MTEQSSCSYASIGSTSSTLLDRLKLRDEAAWQRLVKIYGRLVLYWCRCAGIQRADRVDVSQEVFKTVAAKIDGFRHDQPSDTFRGWLRTITRNKAIDYFRRQDRQPTAIGGSAAHERFLAIPAGGADSAIEASDQERTILVTQVLYLIRSEFEARTWQAFWQSAVEGCPTGAVAETLKMTQATVRQAKSRILRRLREELQHLPEEGCCPEELGNCNSLQDKDL